MKKRDVIATTSLPLQDYIEIGVLQRRPKIKNQKKNCILKIIN
jgi:hypothetical protein